ncbi:MAG: hypothetical protein NTU44_06600 [Bacteroidetes bacterium]|nr:hypothetical protein [Bacteroidota bacterium]
MGACEPDPELNMGWFSEPSKRTMLVHTRAYGYYMGREPVIDRQERYSELNLITHYAPSKTFYVKVTDSAGKPVPNARVEYRLYNYAEFYPLARSFTTADGKTSMTCGLGDLMIWASKDGAFGYKKISVGKTEVVEITLKKSVKQGVTENLDIIPPRKPEPQAASEKGQELNQKRWKQEDSIRKAYMKTFRDSAWVKDFAIRNGISHDSTLSIFKKAEGNWNEMAMFIRNCPSPLRPAALALLYTLSDKDIRDVSAEILQDHMHHLSIRPGIMGNPAEKAFYFNNIASPRIGNEMIRSWRPALKKAFTCKNISGSDQGMSLLIRWIKDSIRIDSFANNHSRAPLSPIGVLELRVSDPRSRDIIFVAVCRSLGLAARLEPATQEPEYFSKGKWVTIKWENIAKAVTEKGMLHLIPGNPNIEARYTQHFTLSRLDKGRPFLYEFPEGQKLSEFPDRTELEEGTYLLTTGNRLSDGGVLSSITFFDITKGQVSDVIVNVREPRLSFTALPGIHPKDFSFGIPGKNEVISGSAITGSSGTIFIWTAPLEEPSRHVLVDIPPFKEQMDKWKGNLVFLLKDEKQPGIPDPATIAALPAKSKFLTDKDNRLMGWLEGSLSRKLNGNLPVVIYADPGGKAWLISEGYTIGIGEMLVKVMK